MQARNQQSEIQQPHFSRQIEQPANIEEKTQVARPKFDKARNCWLIYVPIGNNSLYWSVAVAYLILVKDNGVDFKNRFEELFGSENLDKLSQMENLVQDYNPFFNATDIYENEVFKKLVQRFQERVANYKLSGKPMSCVSKITVMLNCRIGLETGYIYALRKGIASSKLELFKENENYNFSLGKDIGDKYEQLFKVDKLSKLYVKNFIEHFEKKLINYSEEVGLEGKTKNIGKIAGKFKSGAESCKVIPYVGKLLTPLISLSASYVGEKCHRKKAKKVDSAVGKNRISSQDLRKELAEVAFDIFQKFESQFLRATTNEGMERAIIKLAEDAVGRIMNYIKDNADKIVEGIVDISSSFLTEGVILGNSKGGIGATLTPKMLQNSGIPKIPKSGHTVKDESSSEEWKTSEVYEQTGIVKEEDNVTKYYEKKGCNTEKFGYRPPFEWELKRWKELKREYNIKRTSHREEYKYILKSLKSEEIEKRLAIVLDEVNKDTILQLDPLEEKVERGNEGIDELKLGQGTILGKIEALPAKIAGVSNQKIKVKQVWFNMREPVKLFTGRLNELRELHEKLQNDGGQVVIPQAVVVCGLGGRGKTELVRRYAQEHRKDYVNGIWIHSETHESLRGSFKELAEELNIPTRKEINGNIQERSVKSIIKDLYKYFHTEESLFIFDNAEEYNDLKEFLQYPLCPEDKKPHILITSRNQEWVGEEGKINVIPLKDFEPKEAESFVKGFLEINDDSQKEDIEKLTEELQYFPLALRQAVVYIGQENEKAKKMGDSEFKISNYLQKRQQQEKKLLNLGYYKKSNRYIKTVLTTWITTLEKIKEDQDYGEEAIDILNILAYFAPNRVNVKELFLVSETDKRREAVLLLAQYSMIDLKEGIADIHRLVQEVIRLKLEDKNEEEVLKKALTLINSGNISDESISHVTSVWNYASKYDKLIHDFYFKSNRTFGYNHASPLHLLAEAGNDQAIKAILHHVKLVSKVFKKIIDAKDKYNRTPLYLAAENGHECVASLLVDEGAEIDIKSSIAYPSLSTKRAWGWTPLHIAAFRGYLAIVKILAHKNKALINIEDSIGRTPAVLAVSCGQVDIVTFLKPGDNLYLLHAKILAAEKSGSSEDLNRFLEDLEKGNQLRDIVNLKLGEWGPLHLAAFANWLDVAEVLIKNGAEVKTSGPSFTPLHCASSNGHLNLVKFLIEKGADPKDVNKDGWTSLHAAAQNGHPKIVEYFTNLENEKKIDINITDKKHDTPLHTAAFHGKLDVVKFLVEKKANINAINVLGATPLFSAALNNNHKILKFLLNKGAKVINTTDNKTLFDRLNISVLHIAAAYNDKEMMENLINRGVDKDIGKDCSLTPLHFAAFFGNSEATDFLIKEGADINACVKLSNVINVLTDVEKDILGISSMGGIVRRLIKFSRVFTHCLKLTPALMCSNERLLGKKECNLSGFFVKRILNLNYIEKQVDSLKAYVEERKNPDLNRPMDSVFLTGDVIDAKKQ